MRAWSAVAPSLGNVAGTRADHNGLPGLANLAIENDHCRVCGKLTVLCDAAVGGVLHGTVPLAGHPPRAAQPARALARRTATTIGFFFIVLLVMTTFTKAAELCAAVVRTPPEGSKNRRSLQPSNRCNEPRSR